MTTLRTKAEEVEGGKRPLRVLPVAVDHHVIVLPPTLDSRVSHESYRADDGLAADGYSENGAVSLNSMKEALNHC